VGYRTIWDWLIPLTCIVCGFQSRTSFCLECLAELGWIKNPCSICAQELPVDNVLKQCGECLINPPPIDCSIILFHYRFPITSLITGLKFQKKLRYAYPLGSLLAERVQTVYTTSNLTLPECIIPVPLFKTRLRTRGYNQAMELARPIKSQLKIPIDPLSLKRRRSTAPQTLLQVQDRSINLSHAFCVQKKLNVKHVAIVDDVVTTFSTLSEIANLLRKQGVEKIDAWCLARA
jgi:ComF family protein